MSDKKRDIKPAIMSEPSCANYLIYSIITSGSFNFSSNENPCISTRWLNKKGGFKQTYEYTKFPEKVIGRWKKYRGREWWTFEAYDLMVNPEERNPGNVTEEEKQTIKALHSIIMERNKKIKGKIYRNYLINLKFYGYGK